MRHGQIYDTFKHIQSIQKHLHVNTLQSVKKNLDALVPYSRNVPAKTEQGTLQMKSCRTNLKSNCKSFHALRDFELSSGRNQPYVWLDVRGRLVCMPCCLRLYSGWYLQVAHSWPRGRGGAGW